MSAEADRKFFELRESGYTGPIDQDGNAVTEDEGLENLRRLAQEG